MWVQFGQLIETWAQKKMYMDKEKGGKLTIMTIWVQYHM